MDKNSEGTSQEPGVPDPYQACLAQDTSARKISPHNFWLQNPAGIESVEEDAGAVPLGEPTHGLTYSDSLPLSSSTGVALEGHQWYTGRD